MWLLLKTNEKIIQVWLNKVHISKYISEISVPA